MSDQSSLTGIETRFEVQSVLKTKGSAEHISFSAVHHSEAKPENKIFSMYTPVGEIKMTITNPNAIGLFEPGDEYQVTFTKIPAKEAA